MIDELTFADDLTRRQARAAFRWLAARTGEQEENA
jgi:hypothetical protein